MAIKFIEPVKQDRLSLQAGVALGFEDPRAEEYFLVMGWATETTETPLFTYPVGSVTIDPEATFAHGANKGRRILEQEG